jgi:hypothetical protein
MLAGLACPRRAAWPLVLSAAAIVVAASRSLGELNSQRRKGLAGLGEDEGRQDGSDQQPAFREHRNSRHSFHRVGIRPLMA